MAVSDAILEKMTAILEKMGENTKPYEPAFGDPAYQARLRAEGFRDEFTIPVYQNGREVVARGLSEETRAQAVALPEGMYTIGPIKVEVVRNEKYVHLKYKSQSAEDRMKYASAWKDFPDLIQQMTAQRA